MSCLGGLLGGLLRSEAGPVVIAVLERMTRVPEIGLCLPEPVNGPGRRSSEDIKIERWMAEQF